MLIALMMYNLNREESRVLKIVENISGQQIVLVERKNNQKERAINYVNFTGEVKPGDRVIINTTAVDLQLGTGGFHFIIENKNSKYEKSATANKDEGHIMKMRYTPQQIRVLAVEEKAGPYHEKVKNFKNLEGLPVVIIPLHSLLAPFAITFKKCYPEKKLVYIMTEAGALPLELSYQVQKLQERQLLNTTVTVGQSFGGQLEAINIFSALAAASEVVDADIVVVGMGPGQAGTGTPLGFSGMENIFNDFAVKKLGGESIVVPRLSFREKRKRHFFLSHHSKTMLAFMQAGSNIVFPDCELVKFMLSAIELPDKHDYFFYQYDMILNILQQSGFQFESMGRNLQQDPIFFISAALPVLLYKNMQKE